MIISHKYKYLFVELPRTGTTAIANELIENYDGTQILTKHAHYDDFLRQATDEEKKYFVFSCIRNPLDRALTRYYKLKTDYMNPLEDIKRFRKTGKRIRLQTYFLLRQYNYIHNRNASFAQYLKRFYKLPYDDWSVKHHKEFDFIIRFENLNEDFIRFLKDLNIEQKRELPIINKTPDKNKPYEELITDAKDIKFIKQIFGHYLSKWNYIMPDSWGKYEKKSFVQLKLNIANTFRRFYWRFMK